METRPSVSIKTLLGAAVVLYVIYKVGYGITWLVKQRRKFRQDGLPVLPHSWFWGHLKILDDYVGGGLYFDIGMQKIWKDLGEPPFFMVDIAPAQPYGLVVVADIDLLEKVSHPFPLPQYAYGLHKSPTYVDLEDVLGTSSILTAEDATWKALRKTYNSGFSPRYLASLVPDIMPCMKTFISKLEGAVGQTITMRDYTTSLTIDIIATVSLGHSINAQLKDSDITTGFVGMIEWQYIRESLNPFHHFSPIRPFAMGYYGRRLDNAVDKEIQAALSNPAELNPRCVLSLAVGDKEARTQHGADFRRVTREQIKTFLLAGYDTTSSLMQWVTYCLSIRPDVLAKVREELTSIFGPAEDYLAYMAQVEELLNNSPEQTFQKMEYTTAVIKETLRYHTIAGGVTRYPKPGDNLTFDYKGKEVCVDGFIVSLSSCCSHLNKKYWGPDAEEYNPDRWLSSWTGIRAPAAAFRPFERGPRSCIGLELVYIEARILIALMATRFQFEKVFDTKYKSVYSIRKITAKPNDGMRMKLSLAPGQKPLHVKA